MWYYTKNTGNTKKGVKCKLTEKATKRILSEFSPNHQASFVSESKSLEQQFSKCGPQILGS